MFSAFQISAFQTPGFQINYRIPVDVQESISLGAAPALTTSNLAAYMNSIALGASGNITESIGAFFAETVNLGAENGLTNSGKKSGDGSVKENPKVTLYVAKNLKIALRLNIE